MEVPKVMYVLGVDGGGTKTTGVISDSSGHIYAKEQVGATNQNGVDRNIIERELTSLIESLKNQNPEVFPQLGTAFAGMSGVDRPDAKKVMRNYLTKLLPEHTQIVIDNDGVNALYSGTLGAPGIVQISGTGSITFGINVNGERKRVGGWGYLIDDEGSGYGIGRDALNAVFKAFDGRASKTALTEMILTHFNVVQEPDLIKFIYEVGKSRGVIAPLSKLVAQAADRGDEVSKQILFKSSVKIADSIRSLKNQLFDERTVTVVLAGGVFNRSDLIMPDIKEALKNTNCDVDLVKPQMEPVGGAVIAALKHKNIKLQDSFLEKIVK
jgi:N-acetylglucosamine kinase-like BadF-type ATPase